MAHPHLTPLRALVKGPQLPTLAADFLAAKRAANLSDLTITSYATTLRLFAQCLTDAGVPLSAADITRDHIHLYLAWERGRGSKDSSIATRFGHLKIFWKWVGDEEPQIANPMARMPAPKIAETLKAPISDADFAALLKTVSGPGFLDRRNRALLLLAYDSGIRVAGITGLDIADIDLDHNEVTVRVAKGRKPYITRFGETTGQALRRYLRSRAEHPHAGLPALWLTARGRMAIHSIQDMIEHCAKLAGLGAKHIHMHLLRHTAAHNQKAAGLSDEDVMSLFNWDDPKSAARYGKALRGKRARQHYVSPADKLGKVEK